MNGKIVVRKDNATGKLDVEGKIVLLHTPDPTLSIDQINIKVNHDIHHQDLYVMTSTLSGQSSKGNSLQFKFIYTHLLHLLVWTSH